MSYIYLSEHGNFRLLRWAVYWQFTGGFTTSWARVFIEYCLHAPVTLSGQSSLSSLGEQHEGYHFALEDLTNVQNDRAMQPADLPYSVLAHLPRSQQPLLVQ